MHSEPVSLYLDLHEGEKADLEVVARASLAFAAAIKEVAYVLDPSMDVRIELASGTEGSLGLNALVKAIKKKTGAVERDTLKAITIVILAWFAKDAADWGANKIFDALAKGHATDSAALSDDDINRIAERVTKALDGFPYPANAGSATDRGTRRCLTAPASLAPATIWS